MTLLRARLVLVSKLNVRCVLQYCMKRTAEQITKPRIISLYAGRHESADLFLLQEIIEVLKITVRVKGHPDENSQGDLCVPNT